MSSRPKNIILGAGLTGLSAAYAAKDAVVYEKDDKLGGLARTEELDKFRFDLGGHRFLTKKPHIERFVRGILQDELIEVNRKSKIFLGKKLLDYPIKTSILFQINPFELFLMLVFYIYRKVFPIPKKRERSFKEKTVNIFGDEIYRFYFRDYTQKLWGIKCETLSKDWVDARIPNISLEKVVKHMFFKSEKAKSFADKFIYPRYGIGTLCERLSPGRDAHLSSRLTGINHDNDKVTSVIINNDTEVPCKKLVSTIPLNIFAKMFKAPPEVAEAIDKLRYRNLICVFLAMDTQNLTNVHWIYYPGKEIFGRLHEPKNWSVFMAPPDKTGVCLEIFCGKDSNVWKMGHSDIAALCMKDLQYFTQKSAISHKVIKVENAYPIYDLEYRKNRKIALDYLASFKNLRLAGRTGSFNYLNMDICIEEGLEAGEFLSAP